MPRLTQREVTMSKWTAIRTSHHPPTFALVVELSIVECDNNNVRSIALEYNDFRLSLCARVGTNAVFNAVTMYPPSPHIQLTLLVYDDTGTVAYAHDVNFNELFAWDGLTVAPAVRIVASKQVLSDPARELDPNNTAELCDEFQTSAMRTRIYSFDECARKHYTIPPVKPICYRSGIECVPVTSVVDAPNKMVTWVITRPDENEENNVSVGDGVFVPKRKLNKAKPKPNEPAPCGRMSLLQASMIRPLVPIEPRIKELGRPASLRYGGVLDAIDLLDDTVIYVDDSELDKEEEEEARIKKMALQDVGKMRDGEKGEVVCGEEKHKPPSSLVNMNDMELVNLREKSGLVREKLWRNIEPLRLDSSNEEAKEVDRELSVKELEQYTDILLRRIQNIEKMANKHARNVAGMEHHESQFEPHPNVVVKQTSNVTDEEEDDL